MKRWKIIRYVFIPWHRCYRKVFPQTTENANRLKSLMTRRDSHSVLKSFEGKAVDVVEDSVIS